MNNAKASRSATWTNRLINLGLVLVSLALAYVVLGALLLAYGPAIAWKPFNKFPAAATIPWQPSGPKTDDQPYIAILGDSYAQGLGDWNFNRTSRTQSYYSGDVISRQLGLPVLSFGKNGTGSVGALAKIPGAIMHADSCLLFHRPPKPKSLIVYVYGGNDFDNNIIDLRKDTKGLSGEVSIAEYITEQARSMESVPCYEYMKHIFVNLIAGYRDILRSKERLLDHATGQPVKFNGRTGYIPNSVQGPAMGLGTSDLSKSFDILSLSLEHLVERFHDIPVRVVYVPSVVTVYNHLGSTIHAYSYHGGKSEWPKDVLYRSSDSLCQRTRELALSKGLSFVDARPDLRAAAAKREVHGPLDWKHLNRDGQTALGLSVARAIEQDMTDSGCARLAAED